MIEYVEKGIGLHEAIRAAGHWLREENGVWISSDDAAVQAIIDGYDHLGAVKAEKLAALADLRWRRETGGTSLGGVRIGTTDRSKSLITAAADLARRGVQSSFRFKADDGQFVTVDAATMEAIYAAVAAHVQACFDREQELAAAIEACATVLEVEALDITTGWP